ncbi:MAG: hypothetical protein MjAS7_2133 [Metallosphaera javensis (ex Sakai et al. 2022)]|nr:MAG: hypothetical protein MjAS7_2133 [Metallosphaera javensis (ex Sakai et al. 2022)]
MVRFVSVSIMLSLRYKFWASPLSQNRLTEYLIISRPLSTLVALLNLTSLSLRDSLELTGDTTLCSGRK